MHASRWITRTLGDGRIVVELVALELFPSCCSCAPTYGLIAIGADRTVVSWLRAGEA